MQQFIQKVINLTDNLDPDTIADVVTDELQNSSALYWHIEHKLKRTQLLHRTFGHLAGIEKPNAEYVGALHYLEEKIDWAEVQESAEQIYFEEEELEDLSRPRDYRPRQPQQFASEDQDAQSS